MMRIAGGWWVALALLALGAWCQWTMVPGVADRAETGCLVTLAGLRQGAWTVPHTADLPASVEWQYFEADPQASPAMPVPTPAPPFYALLAWPLSLVDWRAAFTLNLLAWLATGALIFAYARRFAFESGTPWIAMLAWCLGSYTLEYSQAIWPACLSTALVMGGFYLASVARWQAIPIAALMGGLLTGAAIGVRYENWALAAIIGAGLCAWSPQRRWSNTLSFILGLTLPVALIVYVNHGRQAGWSLLGPGAEGRLTDCAFSLAQQPWRAGWDLLRGGLGLVVDGAYQGTAHGSDTPARALLQACPWALLALLGLPAAWRVRPHLSELRNRECRMLSLLVAAGFAWAVLAAWRAPAGTTVNPVNLIELLPFLAVAVAWTMETAPWSPWAQVAGLALGTGLAGGVLFSASWPVLGQVLGGLLPMLLAVGLVIGWRLWRRGHAPVVLNLLLPACLAWALATHVGQDWRVRRAQRREHAAVMAAAQAVLDSRPTAILAYGAMSLGLGPLPLQYRLVLLDAHPDAGATTPALARALQARGDRVLVLLNGFPSKLLMKLPLGRGAYVRSGPLDFMEL